MDEKHVRHQKRFVGVDSVVQVNEKGPAEFVGCFLIVSEVRPYGVQGRVPVPQSYGKGTIWINLDWEQMEFVGQAILKPQK